MFTEKTQVEQALLRGGSFFEEDDSLIFFNSLSVVNKKYNHKTKKKLSFAVTVVRNLKIEDIVRVNFCCLVRKAVLGVSMLT